MSNYRKTLTFKKALLCTLLAGVSLTLSAAQAQTLCEDVEAAKNDSIKEEVEVLKKQHEVMDLSREAYSLCIKQASQAVGRAISMGGFLGDVIGSMSEQFDMAGSACDQVKAQADNSISKIQSQIAMVKPYLDKASEITDAARQGKELIEEAYQTGGYGDLIDWGADTAGDYIPQASQIPRQTPTAASPSRPPQQNNSTAPELPSTASAPLSPNATAPRPSTDSPSSWDDLSKRLGFN